jgi:hypothetical protein
MTNVCPVAMVGALRGVEVRLWSSRDIDKVIDQPCGSHFGGHGYEGSRVHDGHVLQGVRVDDSAVIHYYVWLCGEDLERGFDEFAGLGFAPGDQFGDVVQGS